MGDLVLTGDEVNPVISKLEEGGIQITALHHHLDNLEPDILFMHIGGEGDAVELAQTLHDGLAISKTPLAKASAKPATEKLPLDTAELDQIIGRQGKASGGVYHFTVPRAEAITEAGMEIPPAMGMATAINFQPTGDEKAAITGDFVMTAKEVNPVIRALREQGIQVSALHKEGVFVPSSTLAKTHEMGGETHAPHRPHCRSPAVHGARSCRRRAGGRPGRGQRTCDRYRYGRGAEDRRRPRPES